MHVRDIVDRSQHNGWQTVCNLESAIGRSAFTPTPGHHAFDDPKTHLMRIACQVVW